MSRRLPPPPPEELLEELPDDEEELPDEDVEYFVEVEEVSCVFTSVPKSAQLSQTSSSAPSTFTVFGSLVWAPHISH
jgi:hypothetical protein